MNALVKKELREYAAFLILPLVVLLSTAFDADLGERFLAPSLLGQLQSVLLIPAVAAALLGFAQLVREERNGTLSYLVHRELAARALIAAKAAAGLGLVAVLAFAPPLACYAVARAFSPLRDVVQPMRLVEELCVAPAAFAAYGAGVLAATLRGRAWVRGAVALVLALGVLWLTAFALAVDALPAALELVSFPLASLALTAALLGAAASVPLGRKSESRGPSVLPTTARALILIVLAFPVAFTAASLGVFVSSILRPGDVIVAMEAAAVEKSASTHDGTAADVVAMPPRAPGGAERTPYIVREPLRSELQDRRGAFHDVGGLGARWLPIARTRTSLDLNRGRRVRAPGAQAYVESPVLGAGAFLDQDAGVVRVVLVRGDLEVPPGSRAELHALAPADGRLSAQTFEVDLGWTKFDDEADPALLLDPQAKRIYALRLEPGRLALEPLSLPGGDALVDWIPARGAIEKDGVETVLDTLVFRGERGDYLRLGGELVARPDTIALAGEPPTTITLRSDHDLLSPVREAIAPDGSVLAIVERPNPGGSLVAELLAYGCTLTQSPLAAAVAHASEPYAEAGRTNLFRPALYVGGRRAWLLGVHAALALALAARAWSRLGGRRASVPRAVAWTLAILAVGPVAFAAHVLLEPESERDAGRARAPRMVLATKTADA